MAEQNNNQVSKKSESAAAPKGIQLPTWANPKRLVPANKTEWVRFAEGNVTGAVITVLTTFIVSLFKKEK